MTNLNNCIFHSEKADIFVYWEPETAHLKIKISDLSNTFNIKKTKTRVNKMAFRVMRNKRNQRWTQRLNEIFQAKNLNLNQTIVLY